MRTDSLSVRIGEERQAESPPLRTKTKTDWARRQFWSNIVLLSPAFLVYGFILFIPFLLLLNNSFQVNDMAKSFWEKGYTLNNYARFFADTYFLEVIGRTLYMGVLVVVATLFVGYLIAYHIYKAKSYMKTIWITLLLTPSFTGALIQSFGMYLLLSKYGPINALLLKVGLISQPYVFLGTNAAIFVSLVHAFVPFMALPIVNSLRSIPENVLDASRSLGANRFTTFLRVILPLTRGGMLAGSVLVFGGTVGSFATPAIIGQGKIRLLGQTVYTQAVEIFDWPLASVISVVLLLILAAIAATLIVIVRLTGRQAT